MKILLLHQYYLEDSDAGGGRWNEMAKMWAEEGHQITVIAGMVHSSGFKKAEEYKGKLYKIKQQGSVKVLRCHVSESYNNGFVGRLWGYFSFMFSSLLGGLFKLNDKYDVIIVTSPPLFVGISGYFISFFKRIPMVFEVRDLWPESAIDIGVLKNKTIIKLSFWVEKFIYKKSSLINVLTPAFYEKLKNNKGIEENKLVVVPNAADFSLVDDIIKGFDREEFRKMYDLDSYFVITYVGAHGVANHLEQLIKAAKLLEDTNVLFLLIGDGMDKKNLQKLTLDMNLTNVRFMNAMPKKEVLKFVLASEMGTSVLKKVDTFKTVYSNKTFDYFSCKKPILMGIDGVSRKLVEDAKAGTYVEPENITEFDRIIRGYLLDKKKLIEEGENGYNYALENFDRKILGKKFIKCIEKIL